MKSYYNLLQPLPGSLQGIASIKYVDNEHCVSIKCNSEDPALLLSHVDFIPGNEYFFHLSQISDTGNFTIYYITKDGERHSEAHKINISVSYSDHPQKVIVPLPVEFCPQRLRLDPGTRPGEVKIYEMYITCYNQESLTSLFSPIYDRCAGMKGPAWRDLLELTLNSHRIGDMLFPLWPDKNIQIGMTGSFGVAGITQAYVFYSSLMAIAREAGLSLSHFSRILDFGCGYGRITRFFLKDVPYSSLYASDVSKHSLNTFNACFPSAIIPAQNVILNHPMPPLPFPDCYFELITAFSVFSHLSENAALQWFAEFYRILKPGAVLAITLRQTLYMESVLALPYTKRSTYQNVQMKGFGDLASLAKKFEHGEFIFAPTGGGDDLADSFYGEAIIPDTWLHEKLARFYKIKGLILSPSMFQTIVVLQTTRQQGKII